MPIWRESGSSPTELQGFKAEVIPWGWPCGFFLSPFLCALDSGEAFKANDGNPGRFGLQTVLE